MPTEGDESLDATDVDPFESDELSGDVPADLDAGVTAEWKASTTAFQRIHTVLKNTYEPQTTGEIADAAATTKPTVRKHVAPLVEAGMVTKEAGGNATRYAWSQKQRRVNRVAELADEHSAAELDAKVRQAKKRISELRERHDVESPNDLAERLDPDDDAGWDDLANWRTLEDDLKRLKAAQSMTEYLADAELSLSPSDVSNHA